MNTFGYQVTKVQREREIDECSHVVATIDRLLPLVKSSEDHYLIQGLAMESRENADAFGLSRQDVRDLAYIVEYDDDPDWLDTADLDEPGYTSGNMVWDEMEARFGMLNRNPAKWPKQRKDAMRRRAAARRAIADGRAK